jgi:hypothetical protein
MINKDSVPNQSVKHASFVNRTEQGIGKEEVYDLNDTAHNCYIEIRFL